MTDAPRFNEDQQALLRRVARSIDWLGGFDREGIEFDEANWASVVNDARVHLSGRTDKGDTVEVTVEIVQAAIYPDFDSGWDDDEGDDDEFGGGNLEATS